MLCYSNGSLAREDVRDRFAGGSWDRFDAALASTRPTCGGKVGLHLQQPEITPTVPDPVTARLDGSGAPVDRFETEVGVVRAGRVRTGGRARAHVRAPGRRRRCACWWRATSSRSDCTPNGACHLPLARARACTHTHLCPPPRLGLAKPRRLVATGGASANGQLMQVLADVFGCPVDRAGHTDSASLGAAYRALHGWRCKTRGGGRASADSAAQPVLTASACRARAFRGRDPRGGGRDVRGAEAGRARGVHARDALVRRHGRRPVARARAGVRISVIATC